MLEQVVDQRPEQLAVAVREQARAQQLEDRAQGLVAGSDLARPVTGAPGLLDLLDGLAEEEEVLRADDAVDLDVGAVERADGQGTVHRELHVAGARGLLAGGRDLLRQVCGRMDALPALDAEDGNEHHAQRIAHARVAGDHLVHRVDQLGHAVARAALPPKMRVRGATSRCSCCLSAWYKCVHRFSCPDFSVLREEVQCMTPEQTFGKWCSRR